MDFYRDQKAATINYLATSAIVGISLSKKKLHVFPCNKVYILLCIRLLLCKSTILSLMEVSVNMFSLNIIGLIHLP